uniref:DUF427 domain-containing protein n=1 Tax=Coccolithus braarudii TaxID=221442 RepID=A0A7S0LI87_9EUKA|mmetsp:Transcript_41488/g.88502  ORF Transcript_41488/g.88502 Transcript_41488/m.88502 type:complete len:243 (+) Transcript_41488:21-749(+)
MPRDSVVLGLAIVPLLGVSVLYFQFDALFASSTRREDVQLPRKATPTPDTAQPISMAEAKAPQASSSDAVRTWYPKGYKPQSEEDEDPRNFPRPIAMEPSTRHIRITFGDKVIVDTKNTIRILETYHAPVFYIPQEEIAMEYMKEGSGRSTYCEWKGMATYWDVVVPGQKKLANTAWSYEKPSKPYGAIQSHIAFYANTGLKVSVDGEEVGAMSSSFYGGWIYGSLHKYEKHIKGRPGTTHW